MRGRRGEAQEVDLHGLDGERVVVLGGAGLIGSSICRILVASRMEVIAIDRDEEALAVLRHQAPEIQAERVDMTEDQAVKIVATYRPSHLVHAAGIRTTAGSKPRFSADQWSETLAVHMVSPVRIAQSIIDQLTEKKRAGSVTFITSVHSHVLIGSPTYGAAKAGLEQAMRELARIAAPHGIRVNAVAPGHVSIGAKGAPIASPPSVLGGESITPESVARAVRFLICDHCSPHTTGSTLVVDAGLSLVAPWMRG